MKVGISYELEFYASVCNVIIAPKRSHKFLFDIIVLMQRVMDEHMFHTDYYPSLTVCPSCLPIA